MDILCNICTNLVKASENLEATKCGHLYHDHCLAEWLKSSNTCPQCRQTLTADCKFRIYPTLQNRESYENVATLTTLLDDALLELDLEKATTKDLESKLKKLNEEKESLLKKNEELLASPQQELAGPSCQNPPAETNRPDVQNWDREGEDKGPLISDLEPFFPPIPASIDGPPGSSPLPFCQIPDPMMTLHELMNSHLELASKSSTPSKSSSASGDVFVCKNCGRICGSRIGLYSHEKSCLKKNLTNPQTRDINSSSIIDLPTTSKSSSASNSSPATNDVFVCKNCGRICGSRIGLYSHEKSCLKKNLTDPQLTINNSSPTNNTSPSSKLSSANNSSSSANNSSPASGDVFVCKNCGRICGSRIGLYSHEQSCLKKNLTNPQTKIANISSSANNLQSTSKLSSASNSSLSTSKSSSVSSDVFVCKNCGRICGSRIGLYSHEQSCLKKNLTNPPVDLASARSWSVEGERRQQVSLSSSNSGHFPCQNCGRVCGSRIGLYSHEQSCRKQNSMNSVFGIGFGGPISRTAQTQNRETRQFLYNFTSEHSGSSFPSTQEVRPQRQQSRSLTGDFPCYNCGRVCRSQIGLFSHQRSCLNK